MKKLLLIAAVLYAASFAFSFETVLWESDFESFAEGEIIGQVDAYGNQVTVMNNGDRCTGVAPDAGDYTITTFEESKVLKVKRTGGSGGDKRTMLRGAMANLAALTAWALEGAIVTADSMRSRGYGAKKRTNFTMYRFTLSDGVLLALMAALTAAPMAAAAAGYARAEFVPTVYIAGSNTPLGAAGLIAWAILLLIPTILHLWEDMTWRILRSKI